MYQDWRRCQWQGAPLSLLLIDIDRFKALNDHYGHPAGDACLRAVASAINDALHRADDLTARYGGEEFAALLPEVDANGALAVARRLRMAIAALAVPRADGRGGLLTVSIGAATIKPTPAPAPEALIEAADHGLYRAKQAGRDPCCAELVTTLGTEAERVGVGCVVSRQNARGVLRAR